MRSWVIFSKIKEFTDILAGVTFNNRVLLKTIVGRRRTMLLKLKSLCSSDTDLHVQGLLEMYFGNELFVTSPLLIIRHPFAIGLTVDDSTTACYLTKSQKNRKLTSQLSAKINSKPQSTFL